MRPVGVGRRSIVAGRRGAALIAAAVLLAACQGGKVPAAELTPPSPAPSVPFGGQLHTEGTSIVTQAGKTIRLIGVNIAGMDSSNDDGSDQRDACGRGWRAPPPDTASNLKAWGFNSVRLPLAWANLEPTPPTKDASGHLVHHWGTKYLKAVDDIIASMRNEHLAVFPDIAQFQWSSAFKEADGARVVCEGYGMPAWMFPNAPNMTIPEAKCEFMSNQTEPGVPQRPWDGLVAVWQMLADRYGSDPAVIAADTMNEPYFRPDQPCPGVDFPGFFETIGSAIRQAVPHWLLMFEYFPPATEAFHITSPPPFDNSIYQLHVYTPDWPSAQQLMNQGWSQSQQWNMPMLVGEFDAFGAARDKPEPNWVADTKAFLQYMKQRGISWTFWGYGGALSLVTQGLEPKVDLIRVLQTGI